MSWLAVLLIFTGFDLSAETTANVGLVDRMSQAAYDTFNEKCGSRSSPSEEALALSALGASSANSLSAKAETNEGHYFALMAKAHRENLECDIPKLKALAGEDAKFAVQDFKAKIQAIRAVEDLIARKQPQVGQEIQSLMGRIRGEELKTRIAAIQAPLKALYGAREAIRNSIPFAEHGPVATLINTHTGRVAGAGPLFQDLDDRRLAKLLRTAHGQVLKNLEGESLRMDKASKDEGKSLTSTDRNALAKDPALLMQLAKGKQENAVKLSGLQCEVNRRLGNGRDILDNTFDAVTLPVSLFAGGLSLISRGAKAALWAQRVTRVVTLRRARMIQSAALAVDSSALTKEALRCSQDGIGNRTRSGELTCSSTSATVELAQDNCLLKGALLALGTFGTLADLRRVSAMINPALSTMRAEAKLTGAARVEFASNIRQSIGRDVPDAMIDELWEAHKAGQGLPGRAPGTLGGVNPDGSTNYTLTQLKEKVALARRTPESEGGLSHSELKKLLDDGVLGSPTRLDKAKIIPGLHDEWDKFSATVSDSFLTKIERHSDLAGTAGDTARSERALEIWVKLNDCLTKKFENACRKLLAEARTYTEEYQPPAVRATQAERAALAVQREREATEAAAAARYQPRPGHVFDSRVHDDIEALKKLKESEALRNKVEIFLDYTREGALGLRNLPNGFNPEKKHGMRSGPGWRAKYGDVSAVWLNDANRIVYEVKDGRIEIRCIGDCYNH